MARNGRLSSSEKSLILCRQSRAARQNFQLTHVEKRPPGAIILRLESLERVALR